MAVPTLKSTEHIGSRTSLGSGTIMLSPGDSTVSVVLQDLTFIWTFVEGETVKIEVEVPSPKVVQFKVLGQMPVGGTAWSVSEVGTVGGRPLHLAFSARQYGTGDASSPIIRQFTYTFSVESAS